MRQSEDRGRGSFTHVFFLLGLCSAIIIFAVHSNTNLVRIDLQSYSISFGDGLKDSNDDDVVADMTKAIRKHKKDANVQSEEEEDDDNVKTAADAQQIISEGKTIDEDDDTDNVDAEHRKMNVLLLYPDDWRWNELGAENPLIKTPFLDSLAKKGMRFRQNAVTTAICWQSRATLFSGQWASRHQSIKLKCPHFSKGEKWNQTWSQMLRNDGYFTGHIGKWQYWNNDLKQRFDYHDGFEGRHWYKRNKQLYTGDELAKLSAVEFLKRRPKDKNFALSIAFYPPKPVGSDREPGKQWMPKNESRALYENLTIPEPYQNMTHTEAYNLLPKYLRTLRTAGEKRWYERYRTSEHYQEAMKNIYALISQVDESSKGIVEEIEKHGLLNNTLIVVSADNGMFHGAHGLAGKWYPYQESIRVPLIIYDPRMPKDKIGVVDDEHFTLSVDLAETFLGAAGLKPHPRMQGRDISDLYLPKLKDGKTVLERKPWRDEFFYEFDILDEGFIPASNALVRRKHKFIHWVNKKKYQLFDMEKDPLELHDVIDDPDYKEIVDEMKHKLEEIKKAMQEPKLECAAQNFNFIQPKEEDEKKENK